MNTVIDVKNVKFGFTDLPILTDVSFSVYEGDFVSIIGSNGAGKSTTLRLLLGELTPDSGSIEILGKPSKSFKEWYKVGYVPQNAFDGNTSFPATVMEIITANLYHKIGLFRFTKKEHKERAMNALRLVGMEDFSKRMIGELSGGQRQRVMLARALVGEPTMMVLDEPTTGVDAKTIASFYELLKKLNEEQRLTIIMVTHDIAKSTDYVTRTFCLEDGSLVELDKEQIHHELRHKHTHAHGAEHAHTKCDCLTHPHIQCENNHCCDGCDKHEHTAKIDLGKDVQ